MKIITLEDIRDIYLKFRQRGLKFILSKFSISKNERTKSSFNDLNISRSDWWITPKINERWNYLITGDKNKDYETYMTEIFKSKEPLNFISFGSGVCSHELKLAEANPNWHITCVDFSEKRLNEAQKQASKKRLKNINFKVDNVYKFHFPKNHYDIVFFHQSLHHFKNLENFIKQLLIALKNNGKLVINEYVGPNRLQYPTHQIKAINQCLSLISKDYRKIFKTNLVKNKYYGSGWLRMVISDPSECIESEKIIPVINKNFETIIEKSYGGNILMPALKHIAHNFIELDQKKESCLKTIFEFEDDYVKHNKSDFIFGIYQKK